MIRIGQKIRLKKNATGYSDAMRKQDQDGYLIVETAESCNSGCVNCIDKTVTKFAGVGGKWCNVEQNKDDVDIPIIAPPMSLSEYRKRKRIEKNQSAITFLQTQLAHHRKIIQESQSLLTDLQADLNDLYETNIL